MTLGTILILSGVLLVCLVSWLVSSANESPFWGVLGFAASLGILQFVGYPVWETLRASPLNILLYLGLYVIAGVVWSFPKWWFYVSEIRDAYAESLTSYRRNNRIEGRKLTDEEFSDFTRRYFYKGHHHWYTVVPVQVSQNKMKILTWMMYWPTSMLWTLIDQPARKLFLFILEQLKGVYQGIAERAFAGLEVPNRD